MGSWASGARQRSAMRETLDHDQLDDALRRAGSNWNAAQSHGLASGKLAVQGVTRAGPEWLAQVLEGTSAANALRKECESMLEELWQTTEGQLAERMSRFAPLLPDDSDAAGTRTVALAHWCEGYLHGLVSTKHAERIKQRLAAEPVAGIIKDMLAITQATVDAENVDDADELAYAEVVEYVRVAAQLVYEDLAELRNAAQQ